VSLPAADLAYAAYAARVRGTGLLTDPWLDGAPRFREEPVVIDAETLSRLEAAAEAVAAAYHHLAMIVHREPALLDTYFGLSPFQKLMWLAQAPLWHGIARADVFLTADGPRVCELNSDTPSGQAEAVALSRLAAAGRPELSDPNRALETRFSSLIEALAPRARRGQRLSVGIVYPTEMPEDLSMVSLYRTWFESRGWDVVLGSPYNLAPSADGRAALLGRPCDVVVRHYKTDWWGERRPVWDDAPEVPDAAPLEGPLAALLGAALAGRTAVVNPFGAVLTQNKRTLAFFFEAAARFPPHVAAAVRAAVPPTCRLETLDPAKLRAEKDRWVVKSDYGCEGDEVVVGAACTQDEWDATLAHAIAPRWVAQERFDPLLGEDAAAVNHGVYLVAGKAAGIYARVHRGSTAPDALSAPVLVSERGT